MKEEIVGSKCLDVTLLCRLLSVSRSGFYKHAPLVIDDGLKSSAVLHYCRHIRDKLPTAGTEILQTLCNEYFAEEFWLSRDWLYKVLGANDMLLRKKRPIALPALLWE